MPTKLNPMPEMSEKDKIRFWSKVAFTANPNICWEWTGSKGRRGYSQFSIKRVNVYTTSRIAYHLSYKDDMTDLFVCHTCDNPKCCNPKHLFLGTTQDNVDDREKKGRGNGNIGEWRKSNIEKYIGEGHNKSKLTNEQVLQIRAEHIPHKVICKDLAKKYGVSWSTIQNIISRKFWKHI